jgi:ketosteroid isomerase-like protein
LLARRDGEGTIVTDSKIQAVQDIYAAFGRGDIPFILGQLADDVDWASVSETKIAPWHGSWRGRDQVPGFFQGLADTADVTEFTPLAFTSNDTDVMATVRFGLQVRATGKSAVTELHHWWRFRDGRVYFYRGTEDTAVVAALFQTD